ncbi:nucleotidyltransferase domain-containing protein [Candidatus Nitrosacidococcus tergens]
MFGSNTKVYLLGSRTDDTQLGGDIDLLVEVNRVADSSIRFKLKTQLYQLTDEQKIDLVINYANTSETAFQKSIKKNALLL